MDKEQVCCQKFNPALWDEKTFDWVGKKFIKDKVFTLFYIPVNYGAAMTRSMSKVENSQSKIVDGLVLSEHTSLWNMNLYLAVDKMVEDAENMTVSGKFLSKVYEGNFKDTGIWMKDFESYTKNKGITTKKTYMWYTTCPQCAKKYGKNYVVVFGQIT